MILNDLNGKLYLKEFIKKNISKEMCYSFMFHFFVFVLLFIFNRKAGVIIGGAKKIEVGIVNLSSIYKKNKSPAMAANMKSHQQILGKKSQSKMKTKLKNKLIRKKESKLNSFKIKSKDKSEFSSKKYVKNKVIASKPKAAKIKKNDSQAINKSAKSTHTQGKDRVKAASSTLAGREKVDAKTISKNKGVHSKENAKKLAMKAKKGDNSEKLKREVKESFIKKESTSIKENQATYRPSAIEKEGSSKKIVVKQTPVKNKDSNESQYNMPGSNNKLNMIDKKNNILHNNSSVTNTESSQLLSKEVANQGLLMQAQDKIITHLKQPKFFSLPPGLSKKLKTLVQVSLSKDGVVNKVSIKKSSNNIQHDRAAVALLYKASPLPMPQDERIAKEFLLFNITISSDQLSGN